MSPKYTLTYFNLTGLGEPIRYILAYGKIDYEDSRIDVADWPKLKSQTPFGKLPMLDIDGKRITQTVAICRYLGKQLGLVGKSDWDALQADIAVDTLGDFRANFSAAAHEKDETVKAAKINELQNVLAPFYLERFDKLIADNGGYLVNGQLTWADLYFAALADRLSTILKTEVFEKYSNLKALKEKVDNLPGIKEHRANRPPDAHIA